MFTFLMKYLKIIKYEQPSANGNYFLINFDLIYD